MKAGGPHSLGAYSKSLVRVVEGQHRVSTRKLVRSDQDQAVLEGLLDRVKPPAPQEPAFEGLHYLLVTPFRHPPLRNGSRFGTRQERGIFYAAESVRTALAEAAYYRLLFLEGTTAELDPLLAYLTAFRMPVRSERAADLTAPPFDTYRAEIASPTSYTVTQALGQAMRADRVEVVRYPSARDPRAGINVGVFTPGAFAARQPRRPETWICVASREAVEVSRYDLVRPRRGYRFPRVVFEVERALPSLPDPMRLR